jgi:hypothetical protein
MGNRASYPEYSEAEYLVEMHSCRDGGRRSGMIVAAVGTGILAVALLPSMGVTTLATPSNLSESHQGEVRRM